MYCTEYEYPQDKQNMCDTYCMVYQIINNNTYCTYVYIYILYAPQQIQKCVGRTSRKIEIYRYMLS